MPPGGVKFPDAKGNKKIKVVTGIIVKHACCQSPLQALKVASILGFKLSSQ